MKTGVSVSLYLLESHENPDFQAFPAPATCILLGFVAPWLDRHVWWAENSIPHWLFPSPAFFQTGRTLVVDLSTMLHRNRELAIHQRAMSLPFTCEGVTSSLVGRFHTLGVLKGTEAKTWPGSFPWTPAWGSHLPLSPCPWHGDKVSHLLLFSPRSWAPHVLSSSQVLCAYVFSRPG